MNIEKLVPSCKSYLWGGDRLIRHYGKQGDSGVLAESWELSFHKDGASRLLDGRLLADVVTDADLGKNVTKFASFPLLVKLIDAKQHLSLQVHPSDEYALSHEKDNGKTEMWYVVEADEGAGIYLGFEHDVSKKDIVDAIQKNTLSSLLNFMPVKGGDSFFVPAGTVHAICAGCLICEIQENSNITYRVYDYARKDSNGHLRDLHIDKALSVVQASPYKAPLLTYTRQFDDATERLLAVNKHFTAKLLSVKGKATLDNDTNSFRSLTCVGGTGLLCGQPIAPGDTYFIPANSGTVLIEGDLEVIMAEVRTYYIGIDLGGTYIKGGIVDDLGNIILKSKISTESEGGDAHVTQRISSLVEELLQKSGLTISDVEGIGMGVPGMIDSKAGCVTYSNNLAWADFPIAEMLSQLTHLPVKIANDANVAALGEARFGSGKGVESLLLLTLGTGVGGGFVLDGSLFEGNGGAGAEFGHSVIVYEGERCSCGRRGCFEAYASASALIRDTRRAMEAHPDSRMWELGSLDLVTAKTAFDYLDVDAVARDVVEHYISMLGTGVVNYASVLRPHVILLGGGVCAEGERLIAPIQRRLDAELFGGGRGPKVDLRIASLGNSAGILGAAALLM